MPSKKISILLAVLTVSLLAEPTETVFAKRLSDVTLAFEIKATPAPRVRRRARGLDPAVASGAKAILIYLGAQQAFFTESGSIVKMYRISSGAAATPTPVGEFKIYKKEVLRISGQAVPYRMPNYMSFTRNSAYGLHSLPYLGGAAEESAYWIEARDHIGTPVSHGCIRFLPEEADLIYKWADVGVPVYIRK